MADGFWNQPQQQQEAQFHSPAGMAKRPRSDYGHDTQNYFPQDGDRVGSQGIKDTQSIGSAYDRYLQSTQSSFGSGEASADFGDGARLGRGVLGGRPGLLPMGEPSLMGAPRSVGSDMLPNGRGVMGFNGQLPADAMGRPEREGLPLPPDATNTLYIEGLPPDSTKREVAHIFRPFVGYKEVRLVTKESKHRGGDPLILCFVDFANPACAATALSALQGYRMDEHNSDSHILRLQFARFPGARSGSGPRGRR